MGSKFLYSVGSELSRSLPSGQLTETCVHHGGGFVPCGLNPRGSCGVILIPKDTKAVAVHLCVSIAPAVEDKAVDQGSIYLNLVAGSPYRNVMECLERPQ
jgi:hypothetical protein